MLNSNFDPFEALQNLAQNQEILYNNDQQIAQSVNNLLAKLTEQQRIIDQLIKQVESTNRANEILLESFLKEINKSFKDQTWPSQ